MEVNLMRENADGSAVYNFDLTPEESKLFVLLGLKTAIMNGLKEAELWDGDAEMYSHEKIKE